MWFLFIKKAISAFSIKPPGKMIKDCGDKNNSGKREKGLFSDSLRRVKNV
jgi:hypothetical protein